MRIKVLFFLIVAVSSGSRAWALERQDSLETTLCGTSKVYFRFGSSVLEPNYRNNVKFLESLVDTANAILSDTINVSRRIKLLGNASPDGAMVENLKLAEGRTKSVKLFILKNSRLPSSQIIIENIGVDWDALRASVVGSDIPDAQDVLNIIDTVQNRANCVKQLQALNKGASYRYMLKAVFPDIRVCTITYVTDVHPETIVHPDTIGLSGKIVTLDSIGIDPLFVKDTICKNASTSKLIFGIKTNLFYWAGISPELKYRGLMPNIALEAFLGNRYSVQIEGVYTSLDKKNTAKETWAVSGITLEPRIWLNKNSRFTGFYTGLYGQYGDFDVKLNDISTTQGYTGTFFAAGLSLGYHYAISNAFGLEVGLGAGYRQAGRNEYIYRETNHYYLERSATESTFGLHQIRLSVVYRFDKITIN